MTIDPKDKRIRDLEIQLQNAHVPHINKVIELSDRIRELETELSRMEGSRNSWRDGYDRLTEGLPMPSELEKEP